MSNRANRTICLMLSIVILSMFPIIVEAKTIYVDDDAAGANDGTSWANAYVCLQDALSSARNGDKIHVAKGTYRPDQWFVEGRFPRVVASGDREASFQLINGVALIGGFASSGGLDPDARDIRANETILNGDLAGNDNHVNDPTRLQDEITRNENSYRVVLGDGTDETAILDGFIITGGNANGDSPSNCGGGLHNLRGSPTVRSCTFVANSASDLGGGSYNANSSSPLLQSCTFRGNSAGNGGGLGNRENSNPKVENCVFIGNSSGDGAGVCNQLSSPTLSNCTFESNKAFAGGGGMNNYNNSAPVVNTCFFIANSADYAGGGVYSGVASSPEFIGCTFRENSAAHSGGGAVNADDFGLSPKFADCTFTQNTAGGNGGGMHNMGSSPMIIGCEFRGNRTDDGGGAMDNKDDSQPILTDCVFNGNSANRGGGILNWFGAYSKVTNCTFTGNSAGWVGGAICDSNSVMELTNNLFCNNLADGGGVIFFDNCSGSTLSNCTLTGNTALYNGDAILCDSDSPSHIKLTNCIIWDENNEIWNNDGSIIELTYSNIRGRQASLYDPYAAVIWGEGNKSANPLFADAAGGDYHLKSQAGRWDPISESWVVDDVTSPCIDAGDPNTPAGGEPEPNGGRINMGAYGGTAEASMSPLDAGQIVYIQWLGHSTVKVWTEDCIVYVDPERVPDALHDATLVCVTHTHGDHYSPSDIAKVSNTQTKFIGPPDVVQQYGKGQTIAPGQMIELGFVNVIAVPAYNTNKSNHPRSNNWVGYILELGGKRIYIAGDTDLIEEMKSLGDIDVAFLPAGGTYTMNAVEAAEATQYIKPDLAIPYHWGQSVGTLADAQRFAELARCAVKILAVGETIGSDEWPEYQPLVAHWTIDESEGNVAHDNVGEHDGALNGGPAWLPEGGKINGALQFDGMDDYVSTSIVLDPAEGVFSAFAWVKGGGPGQVILSQTNAGGEIWIGANLLQGSIISGLVPLPAGRTVTPALESQFVITDGQWHHVGFVWDGSRRHLYADGVEVAVDAGSVGPLTSSDGGMLIGAGKDLDATSFWFGLIDDVRIYDQAMEAEDIETLMR